MSLQTFFFHRKLYDDMIKNIENIIENIENINIDTENCMANINLVIKNDFNDKLNHIRWLRCFCDQKINELCNHEFVNDLIDIDPERSENITYCKICGFSK
jgi:hypothetical protein